MNFSQYKKTIKFKNEFHFVTSWTAYFASEWQWQHNGKL